MKLRRRLCEFIDGAPRRRQTVQKGKNAGIAKLLIADTQDHAGMGLAIDVHHVLTCAHVVNVALERDMLSQDRPEASVEVAFPMLGNPASVSASIVGWRPPGELPQDDIAVLRLEQPVPAEAGTAVLADVTGMSLDGDELSVFGLAQGERLGTHIDARFKGPTSAAWVQINGVDNADTFIQEGFSGAAVWDQPHSAVLGMMVAKNLSESQRVAYMIPVAELSALRPSLRMEHRGLSPAFARTWTMFAAAYFLLLLAHWAWDRGTEAFSVITIAGGHKHLAAFWGMHLYAFLTPFLLWMLIAFARSFRLHDWPARVPSFGAVRPKPVSSSTARTAALSLMAFVILPLAAQIHFLNQFLTKGDVYIYPDKFGYTLGELRAAGETCFDASMHYCTKKDRAGKDEAGRFSRAVPKAGSTGAYWDNAYHFGDRNKGDGSTKTFFPILQPVIILMLTALSAALAALAIYLVLRPTPEQSQRRKLAAVLQQRQTQPMAKETPLRKPPA
jgi:hypothetical protein